FLHAREQCGFSFSFCSERADMAQDFENLWNRFAVHSLFDNQKSFDLGGEIHTFSLQTCCARAYPWKENLEGLPPHLQQPKVVNGCLEGNQGIFHARVWPTLAAKTTSSFGYIFCIGRLISVRENGERDDSFASYRGRWIYGLPCR